MEGERHDTKRQGEADGERSAEEAMVEGRDGRTKDEGEEDEHKHEDEHDDEDGDEDLAGCRCPNSRDPKAVDEV